MGVHSGCPFLFIKNSGGFVMDQVVEEKKELIMRKLSTRDGFKLSKILRQLGMKEQIKLFLKGVSVDGKSKEELAETQKQMGIDLFSDLLDSLSDAEPEIADFIGGLVGLKGDEFLDLPIEDCIEVLKQFKNQTGLRSFLQLAAR
jgi:hypothetical protein